MHSKQNFTFNAKLLIRNVAHIILACGFVDLQVMSSGNRFLRRMVVEFVLYNAKFKLEIVKVILFKN